MDWKKDRRVRSIIIKIGCDAIEKAQRLAENEDAKSPAGLAVELTQTALVVALVLIPIGLYYLNSADTTNMTAQEIVAIGAIGIIIVVAIILAILDKAMTHKK
jgi:hypothetical protein